MAAPAGGVVTAGAARSDAPGAGSKSPVAWTPSKDIDVVGWVKAGHQLGAMTRCSQWLLGDWIRYGTARWGEKYTQAARITGYDVHSLRNIAYVAGRVDVSRRRDTLTWSHHAEVCPLEPDDQDEWLDRAASEGMSVADLRIELRSARRKENGSNARSEADVKTVTCPECEHQFEIPSP